jgi:hypothetical protein
VDALNVFIGLNILDGLARFGALNALARLALDEILRKLRF